MISHIQIHMQVDEYDSYFSYLPLAHIFDQVIENYCISKGASIGFWQGVWRYILQEKYFCLDCAFII
jgi:long-subunit acyl-CoA synthetase (AMP-forming)